MISTQSLHTNKRPTPFSIEATSSSSSPCPPHSPPSDPPRYANIHHPFLPVDPPHIPKDMPLGLFKTTFCIPDHWKRKHEDQDAIDGRLFLTFEAVRSAMALWINGMFVGYRRDSFSPHSFLLPPSLFTTLFVSSLIFCIRFKAAKLMMVIERDGPQDVFVLVWRWAPSSDIEDQDFWVCFHLLLVLCLVFMTIIVVLIV